MQYKLLQLLCCPKCRGDLTCHAEFFSFLIPVANYVKEKSLTRKQRYDWAILDTFDMLAPHFDQPQTQAEAEAALSASGIRHLRRMPNPGLNLTGTKSS